MKQALTEWHLVTLTDMNRMYLPEVWLGILLKIQRNIIQTGIGFFQLLHQAGLGGCCYNKKQKHEKSILFSSYNNNLYRRLRKTSVR